MSAERRLAEALDLAAKRVLDHQGRQPACQRAAAFVGVEREPQRQFGMRSGTMVTTHGKNHKSASPRTWISTKGMMPR